LEIIMHHTEDAVHEAMGAGVPETGHSHLERALPARNDTSQATDASLDDRIAHAMTDLAQAERRLQGMQMSLRVFDRNDPALVDLLPVLHALERLKFNRQLELDALLGQRRQSSAPPLNGAPRRR
jgi:hypothetical protein